MKRVATAVVLIPIVLLAILRAPIWLLAVIVGIVALLTTHEFLDLAEKYNIRPLRRTTYIYVGLLFAFLAVGLGGPKPLLLTSVAVTTMLVMAVVAPFLLMAIGMARDAGIEGQGILATVLPAAAAGVVAFTYIALPLGLLVQVREMWAGAFLLLYLLIAVWAGDTFAYYTGRAIGRHKMAPRISPGKTWEGAVASFIGAVVVGVLVLRHGFDISSALLRARLIEPQQGYLALQPPPVWPAVVLSGVINVAAQVGDLVESLIKRGAGVKDSGSILPGHGGMLDRIDALLFAAPVLWYYAAWQVMS
ncbi:MAG: phosphatidate cytidylyltransferase [Terriglobales bacterium]